MLKSDLVNTISQTFSKGKSIRRNLAHKSKLVIDQKLPYICVYRFTDKPDPYMVSLLKTQGAYLIANCKLDINELLETLIEIAIKDFKSYLIFELWHNDVLEANKTFRLLHPEGKADASIKALEKGFLEFNDLLPGITVVKEGSKHRHPEYLEPLVDLPKLQNLGALLIGIEIPDMFRDKASNKVFPLFFRRVRRKFAEIIKVAAFEFVRLQADNQFEHYLMLGKTRLDNLVRSADRRMAEISEKMDFILSVTPVNTSTEWEKFKQNNYSVPPHFSYRLISLDPEIEKRKLFSIPLEKIEHTTLAFLLRDKRMELEKQLLMLEERGTKKFFHTSQSLYGDIDKKVKIAAQTLLSDDIPNEQSENNMVNAIDFARVAEKELDKYREKFPQIPLRVKVKENVTGLLVSGAELSIGKDLNLSFERVEALIQHEVGTHLLTYCNGHMQPLQLMYAGLPGYEQLQEGMAVLAEFLVGGLNINRLKLLAARVIAVDSLIAGADFIETFHMLTENYGFKSKTAFNISMRVHRGGGYTKDAIYLKGLLQLMHFIEEGGDMSQLYAGKFALEHLPLIQELTQLNILKKPYLPDYLSSQPSKEKIKQLKKGMHLRELVS